MERLSLGARSVNVEDNWVDFGGWVAEIGELYVVLLETVSASPDKVYSSFKARITYEIEEGVPAAWVQEQRFLYDSETRYFTFTIPEEFPKERRVSIQVKRISIYTVPRQLATTDIGIDVLSEKKFER